MFVVLFALSTGTFCKTCQYMPITTDRFEVVHLAFALRYRLWWAFPTILLAGAGEILGWIGRSWSTWDVTNKTPFRIQSVTISLHGFVVSPRSDHLDYWPAY